MMEKTRKLETRNVLAAAALGTVLGLAVFAFASPFIPRSHKVTFTTTTSAPNATQAPYATFMLFAKVNGEWVFSGETVDIYSRDELPLLGIEPGTGCAINKVAFTDHPAVSQEDIVNLLCNAP
jgi:hypothetical protein